MMRRTVSVAIVGLAVLCIARTSSGLFHLALIDEVMTSYGGDATGSHRGEHAGGVVNLSPTAFRCLRQHRHSSPTFSKFPPTFPLGNGVR
jgi:hypothetical protein